MARRGAGGTAGDLNANASDIDGAGGALADEKGIVDSPSAPRAGRSLGRSPGVGGDDLVIDESHGSGEATVRFRYVLNRPAPAELGGSGLPASELHTVTKPVMPDRPPADTARTRRDTRTPARLHACTPAFMHTHDSDDPYN
jgi:hypothetical protein